MSHHTFFKLYKRIHVSLRTYIVNQRREKKKKIEKKEGKKKKKRKKNKMKEDI